MRICRIFLPNGQCKVHDFEVLMDFDQCAKALANKPAEIREWQFALETAWLRSGAAFPTKNKFVDFAKCFSEPELFSAFIILIGGMSQMRQFLQTVDASNYSTEEWVKAMKVLDTWLKAKDREVTILKRIGYVACCAEATSVSSVQSSLEDATIEMIDTHGID